MPTDDREIAFRLEELAGRAAGKEHVYFDFFSSDELSLGLAWWPVGAADDQQPHTEDEVYLCLEGSARLRVGKSDYAVHPGSVIFVAAGVEHRFHSIEEGIRMLVLWAPPRHSRRAQPG
jgi:mannose-6-phosphate isomerase-like protein (cupin superfamily)